MLTYAMMIILILVIAASALFGIKVDKDKDSFMSIDDTTFLRGIWCIIIVLVHIPVAYQNSLQDMLGSFAYIGVTFFFMTSAYGLKYSIVHKKGYMDHFWRRRLPSILIPALIANAFEVLMNGLGAGISEISVLDFVNINNWVKVLLLYYLLFWLIYYVMPEFAGGILAKDIVMCLFVVVCSLVGCLTSIKITSIWIVEPLGFAYGIIAANHSDKFKSWIKGKWFRKCGLLMGISGILGITYLKMKPVAFWGDYLLKIVLGIAIIAFIFEAISRLKVGNRVNSLLGYISYEVYLLHHGVFALLMAIDSGMNSGVFVILSVAITVVLAFMLNKVCKPLVKFIR